MDPITVQVDAYNAHDTERFLHCYAEDVEICDGIGAALVRGYDEMRAEFARLFEAAPELHAEVLSRLEVGEYVLVEERIAGYGGEPLRGVMVYHLRGDVIDRCIWLTWVACHGGLLRHLDPRHRHPGAGHTWGEQPSGRDWAWPAPQGDARHPVPDAAGVGRGSLLASGLLMFLSCSPLTVSP